MSKCAACSGAWRWKRRSIPPNPTDFGNARRQPRAAGKPLSPRRILVQARPESPEVFSAKCAPHPNRTLKAGAGFNWTGRPAAMNTAASQASAISWFARPCQSRNSRPSLCSGTIPRPTSFDTRTAGPASAPIARDEPGDGGAGIAPGQHQIAQPKGQAVDDHDPAGTRFGAQAPERPRAAPPASPSPATVGPVAGDPRRHLLIPRLGGRQIEPLRPVSLGKALRIGAFSRPRAAEHQQAADAGRICDPLVPCLSGEIWPAASPDRK